MESKVNTQQIPEVKISYSFKVARENRIKVSSSMDGYNVLKKCYDPDTMQLRESAKILLLNRANQILGVYNLSEGGTSSTVVDVKMIVQASALSNASGVILSHNHPSGNPLPSESDKALTRKVKSALQYMDVVLLDHIILTEEEFTSFADEGLM